MGNINSLRIPINNTAGAGIHTGQWYCRPYIYLGEGVTVVSPLLKLCGKAWSDANGKEYAAFAIQAPPATLEDDDNYNPVSNPNITIFKAKEARTTLPIQLNSTEPYVISQMVNTGNVFDSKAAKTGTTKPSRGIVLMDKANPVGIFYSETCRDGSRGGNAQASEAVVPTVFPTHYPTISVNFLTEAPTVSENPTFSPTTAEYEPGVCGQLMYADYIAYYFDGHGRVTIGVTGTVGETAFF